MTNARHGRRQTMPSPDETMPELRQTRHGREQTMPGLDETMPEVRQMRHGREQSMPSPDETMPEVRQTRHGWEQTRLPCLFMLLRSILRKPPCLLGKVRFVNFLKVDKSLQARCHCKAFIPKQLRS